MKQAVLLSLAALAIFSLGHSQARADQAAYAVCIACHGENGEGNAALNSPALASQEIWYV